MVSLRLKRLGGIRETKRVHFRMRLQEKAEIETSNDGEDGLTRSDARPTINGRTPIAYETIFRSASRGFTSFHRPFVRSPASGRVHSTGRGAGFQRSNFARRLDQRSRFQ